MTGDTQRVHELMSAAPVRPRRHPGRVILTVAPIGLWTISLVLDVASRAAGARSIFAELSMPLIGIGVFAALAAAMLGLVDLLAIPPESRAFRIGLARLAVNVAVIVAYMTNFCWRDAILFESVPVPMGPLVLSAASLAALVLVASLDARPGPDRVVIRSSPRAARRLRARRPPR